uniref:G protein-coupled receptor n=1 Tax=Bursaphelenchus xylophilus TaxID=6326 RepID=A0A1I7RXQ1_BURXY
MRLPDFIESEERRNRTFYLRQWLSEPDDDPGFRIALYSTELLFEFASVPIGLVIAICIYRTQTFHPNIRLIMLNDIFSGVVEMICRFAVVANFLSKSTLLSVATIDTIQYYRPLFIYQVQFSFLNLLWERMLAVRFPERYEKAPISIGICILIVWWIFIAFLIYVVSPVISGALGFIVHICALGLTRHWIKMQRAYPKSTANLSTRYQISENIKTLLMFRYWVYFYVAMSVIEKIFLLSAYICFLKTQKGIWHVFCNLYDLSHAFYVFAFPAFLLYGSSSLRRHLANLCGRRSRMIRASEKQVRIENSRLVNTTTVSAAVGLFVHFSALFLTRRWIRTQRSYPTNEVSLSTKYQISENIRALVMCRYWIYFYFVMSMICKFWLFLAYISFMKEEKETWRLASNLYDLSHAIYVLFYPAFLVYGNRPLRKRLVVMFGRRNGKLAAVACGMSLSSLQSEDRKNFTDTYNQWLDEPDYPSSFRIAIFFVELCFDIGSIPTNLIIAWCFSRMPTFHPNLRLLLMNDILSGVLEILSRILIVLNVFDQNKFLPPEMVDVIQHYRGLFMYQVQFCFLNILLERSIAMAWPDRYERVNICVGVVILVVWWIFFTLFLYVIRKFFEALVHGSLQGKYSKCDAQIFLKFCTHIGSRFAGAAEISNDFCRRESTLNVESAVYVALTLGIILHFPVIILTSRWIKTQRLYPTYTASLSTKYQVSENIRVLLMCRHWLYFYIATNMVSKAWFLLAIRSFIKNQKTNWRMFSNLYDLTHAIYMFFFPIFLVYGNRNLQKRLKTLFGVRRGKVEASEKGYELEENSVVDTEDFSGHFRRLQMSWESDAR